MSFLCKPSHEKSRSGKAIGCLPRVLKYLSNSAPIWGVSSLLLATTMNTGAGGMKWESVGIRFGYSLTSFSDPFYQPEVYSDWDLPWVLKMGSKSQWTLKPKLELSMGCLTGRGEYAFIGSAGPVAVLRYDKSPVYFQGGVCPTYISRDTFGERDLGCPVEFTSHLGLGWDIGKHWNVTYRFQHMSNAGLGSSNPGLNMNMFGVGYRF